MGLTFYHVHSKTSFCPQQVISDRAFEKLGSLTYLKIANNRLPSITSLTLSGLEQLQFFEAEYNRIKSVAANAFTHSPSMIIVHLYNNEIASVHADAFSGADASVLTLHDNKLTTLPAGVFDSLQTLSHVALYNNPWRCDCNISWVYNWTKKQDSNFAVEKENLTLCSEPSARQGTPLLQYLADSHTACLAELNPGGQPDNTTDYKPGTTGGQPNNQDSDMGTKETTVIAIIVASLALAIILLVLVAIGLYCRHKKYAFWAPPKTDKTDGKIRKDDLKFKARHEIGSFYQDPQTGKVSAMWETESVQSFRHMPDPEDPETDSVKNRYVYENAAMDMSMDDPVVVVDSNATKVQHMPPPLINGHAGSDERCNSLESIPNEVNAASVSTHGYDDVDAAAVSLATTAPRDDLDRPGDDSYEMGNLNVAADGAAVPAAAAAVDAAAERLSEPGTPTAHSISSISDVEEEEQREEPQKAAESHLDPAHIHPHVPQFDPGHLDLHVHPGNMDPHGDPDHLDPEPSDSKLDEGGVHGGLARNISAQISGEYEHLNQDPPTPTSPHDYEALQPELPRASSSPDTHHVKSASNTEAHGGTAAAFVNEAYDISDEQ